MGYFSNGTEGMIYEADWCLKCVHHDTNGVMCPVMELHMDHNHKEARNPGSFLDVLIPRSKDKLGNERCNMFYRAPARGDLFASPQRTGGDDA